MSDLEYMQAFLHPKKKEPKPAVKVFRGGREVCQIHNKAGMDEYQHRKRQMWERQRGICCLYGLSPLCLGLRRGRNGRIPFDESVFEHEHGRGGGKQDDRIEVELDGKMVWQNGASCPYCNSEKGSKKVPYNYMDVP